jgi:tryptophanyl-tRNA synthetase
MAEKSTPVMLSGIQPTGALMIGNYVGALKHWVELQATHASFFLLADLHAITVPQDPADLQHRSLEFVALLLACGVDAERGTIFLQSHVPAHTQLLWVLNSVVSMGELQRMTQFKDKVGRSAANLHVGLFDYPVLMAADILLYGADLVPVGDDQKQHMEFTRHLARKFNGRYGEVFKIPEAYTPRTGARLMGLQAPSVKMSKSDRNEDNYVALLDRPEVVRRKIKTAVTDSGSEVRCDAASRDIQPDHALCGRQRESVESIQNRYAGQGYAEFKRSLAELIIDFLSPIQARYASIAADPAMLAEVLKRGRAMPVSVPAALARVYRAVGFVPDEGPRRRVGGRRSSSERQSTSHCPRYRGQCMKSSIMETKETKEVTAAAGGEVDAEAECMTDLLLLL